MQYSRENPSRKHLELLEHYTKMHAEGYTHEVGGQKQVVSPEKTFPGRKLPEFIVHIKEYTDKYKAKTILDYGSGKGVQHENLYTINDGAGKDADEKLNTKQIWGVDSITCYDPGLPGFNELPDKKFDGVVCTDVLEHCCVADIPWIVKELFSFSEKFLFANVACYPAAAKLPTGENAHCTIRHPQWWTGIFAAIANDFPEVDYVIFFEVVDEQGKGQLAKVIKEDLKAYNSPFQDAM